MVGRPVGRCAQRALGPGEQVQRSLPMQKQSGPVHSQIYKQPCSEAAASQVRLSTAGGRGRWGCSLGGENPEQQWVGGSGAKYSRVRLSVRPTRPLAI